MKNILSIGRKSKQAFENLKGIDHKKINKALEDYIKLILVNKKVFIFFFYNFRNIKSS